jgi:hypothetical protein
MPCSQLRLLSKYSVNVFDALHICRLGLVAKIASIQSRKNRTANEVLRSCEIGSAELRDIYGEFARSTSRCKFVHDIRAREDPTRGTFVGGKR